MVRFQMCRRTLPGPIQEQSQDRTTGMEVSSLLTFHKIIAGCEAGEADTWRGFLQDYTPIVGEWARVYLPGLPENDVLWKDSLAAITEKDFAALRAFDHQSEREFLVGLRAFYLGRSASASDLTADAQEAPSSSSMAEALKGVPLVHQEVVLLKLAGYSNTTLEKMFRLTPAVAKTSLSRLETRWPAALNNASGHGLYPAAWLQLLREVWEAKTDACPPLRLFVRIQDGQIGWAEKDPAETHIAGCLHCLERWTALREITFLRREAKPVPATQVEALLAGLPVRESGKKPKPLVKRLFG